METLLGKHQTQALFTCSPCSKSLQADCSSQSLLVSSLTFSSSCLSLLDPGNSETCTKSKIQNPVCPDRFVQYQLSTEFNLEAGSRKPEEQLQFRAG